jgi:hypothetical protein
MGDPTYTTYLPIHRAWQWQWHGREGSVYPVAPLLGPGRGARLDNRGLMAAAGAMLGAGCYYSTPLHLHLDLLRFPRPAPLLLALAGGTGDAKRRSLHGKAGRGSLAGLATLAGGNLQN